MGTEHLLLCSEEPSTDFWPQTVKSRAEHNISPPPSLYVFLFIHNCHPLLRNQHAPCMYLSVHLTVFQSRWRCRQYVTPKVGTFPAQRQEISANQPSSEHRSLKHANPNREAHFFFFLELSQNSDHIMQCVSNFFSVEEPLPKKTETKIIKGIVYFRTKVTPVLPLPDKNSRDIFEVYL
jgi:hypothetical protein